MYMYMYSGMLWWLCHIVVSENVWRVVILLHSQAAPLSGHKHAHQLHSQATTTAWIRCGHLFVYAYCLQYSMSYLHALPRVQ